MPTLKNRKWAICPLSITRVSPTRPARFPPAGFFTRVAPAMPGHKLVRNRHVFFLTE